MARINRTGFEMIDGRPYRKSVNDKNRITLTPVELLPVLDDQRAVHELRKQVGTQETKYSAIASLALKYADKLKGAKDHLTTEQIKVGADAEVIRTARREASKEFRTILRNAEGVPDAALRDGSVRTYVGMLAGAIASGVTLTTVETDKGSMIVGPAALRTQISLGGPEEDARDARSAVKMLARLYGERETATATSLFLAAIAAQDGDDDNVLTAEHMQSLARHFAGQKTTKMETAEA